MATDTPRDEDLVDLLERYRVEVAALNKLERGSDAYVAQLRVEEALSRRIRRWSGYQGRGARD